MKYSWKAITCCVSKGMLIVLAMASILGGSIYGSIVWAQHANEMRKAKDASCDRLRERVRDAKELVFIALDSGQFVGPGYTGPKDPHHFASTPESKPLEAQYAAECGELDPVSNPTRRLDEALAPFFLPVLNSLCAFACAAFLLATICRESIAYCQAAVDTGRRPWYWLPRIGNPLPKRQTISDTCPMCEHTDTREETETEYRARLGLGALEKR